ncbi:putative agrB-like protein putative [Clostridium sp. CAG:533]|nr:putative agrB-like protein putative [Clostridium sp. CAG:533]
MKEKFIASVVNLAKRNKEYTEEEVAIMRYALEGIYLTFTKILVITLIAALLGLFKEYIWFVLLYTPIRSVSFGWHANTTKECWVVSILAFILIPYTFSIITINRITKIILLTFSIFIFALYSPADTKKRPIVNKKRRLMFKVASLIITLVYCCYSFKHSNLISNLMLASLLYQSMLINPLIYKISHQEFNNFKAYNLNE